MASSENILNDYLYNLLKANLLNKNQDAMRLRILALSNPDIIVAIKSVLGQKIVITSPTDDNDYILNLEDADVDEDVLIFSGRRDKANLYLKGYYGSN